MYYSKGDISENRETKFKIMRLPLKWVTMEVGIVYKSQNMYKGTFAEPIYFRTYNMKQKEWIINNSDSA